MRDTLPFDLLESISAIEAIEINQIAAENRKNEINDIFDSLNVDVRCLSYKVGPSFTCYDIDNRNVSVKDMSRLANDIAIRLGGIPIRFVPINAGKPYSVFEIPNEKQIAPSFKEALESLPDASKYPLAIPLGQDVNDEFKCLNLNDAPHMLIAGTTGSGKSIYLHDIIASLIARNSPEELKLVLFDPKMVEMSLFKDMPHLLCPIIHKADIAFKTLNKLVEEMNRRYGLLFEKEANCIETYNKLEGVEKLPYIVVVIDEYADLVDAKKEISAPIVVLAQKARAAGIHLIVATQRPSTNVITGVIKANLPTRISFAVVNSIDSMTILGELGGEKLMGRGDMLVQSPVLSKINTIRLQAPFISNKDIKAIVNFYKERYETHYSKDFTDLSVEEKQTFPNSDIEEEKYQEIKKWVMDNEYMSMSRIQRECSVGFNKAGRIFKRLMEEGIIGEETDNKKGNKVLIHEMSDRKYDNLLQKAKEARLLSYSRYSKFAVGAALLTRDGEIFLGANIENSSYPLCMCAERNALYNAMMHGYKKEDFVTLAICADTDQPVSPCGACRQVIHELFPLHAPILLTNLKGDVKETCAEELLPFAFTGDDLK